MAEDEFTGAPQSGVPVGADQRTYELLKRRPMIAIPIPSTAASLNLLGGPCILCGWAIRENAAAAATFELISGSADADAVVGSVALLASTSSISSPAPDGPYCPAGLRLKRDTGTVKGAVWVKV